MSLPPGAQIDAYVANDPPENVPEGATPRTVLLAQLRTALVRVAIDILGEAPATPYHAQRATYAAVVLGDPANAAMRFLRPIVVINGESLWASILTGATLADSTIRDNVSAAWNAVAGVVTA